MLAVLVGTVNPEMLVCHKFWRISEEQVEAEMTGQDRRRKRGRYHHYTPKVRTKMAKYASEHANKAAVTKFSRQLEYSVTIRNIKSAYLRKLRSEKDPNNIVALPHGSVGRPGPYSLGRL